MSDPADFLRDPQYPRRPQHPDFWRLAELAMQLDGQAQEGGRGVDDLAGEVVDMQSLLYMASNKTQRAAQIAGFTPSERQTLAMASLYLEGFMLGVRYQQSSDSRQEGS